MTMTEKEYTGYITEANVARTVDQYELVVWVQMTRAEFDELYAAFETRPPLRRWRPESPSDVKATTWPSYIEVVDEVTERWALKERVA